MKKNLKKILAFTLAELVIAVTISSIIFLGIINLVGDTLSGLSVANRSSELIISLNDVIHQFEALNRTYENKEILISKDQGEGTDVLLLSNSGSTGGAVIALINPHSKKIYENTSSYQLYNQKHIGYRILSSVELARILATPEEVYGLTFFQDKVFTNIYLRDFQILLFNGGKIVDMNLSILLQYGKESEGIVWEDLGNDKLYHINLNF